MALAGYLDYIFVRTTLFLPLSISSSTLIFVPSIIPSSFRNSSGIVILPLRTTEIMATSFRISLTFIGDIGNITFICFTFTLVI